MGQHCDDGSGQATADDLRHADPLFVLKHICARPSDPAWKQKTPQPGLEHVLVPFEVSEDLHFRDLLAG